MKSNFKISALLLALFLVLFFSSCQKQEDFDGQLKSASISGSGSAGQNTFYSSTLLFGKGIIRAWVTENSEGKPLAVGVNFSVRSLATLPDVGKVYALTLPKNKGENFYKLVMVDWNPRGHDPIEIYGLPHFDFHFYIVPETEVLAIGLLAPPAFDTAPIAQYIPPAYFQTPGIVPQMGTHWIDALSPEISQNQKFTRTFIWGSYHGEFIFWEPMITREYLLSMPDEIIPVRQPASFQRSGWYPGAYKISHSASPDEYTVALVNLTYHAGE